MSTFDKSVKKGIPNDIEIILPFADVLDYSTNPREQAFVLIKALGEYMHYVGKQISAPVSLFSTNRLISIVTKPDTLDKKIYLSDSLLKNLINLNLVDKNGLKALEEGEVEKTKLTEDEFVERIAKLKLIKNEKQLKEQFPILFEFKKYIDKESNLLRTKTRNINEYIQYISVKRFSKEDIEFLKNSLTVKEFCEIVANTLLKIKQNIEPLSNAVIDFELTNKLNKNISKEHFELYLADFYLRVAELAETEEEKQKAMYYVSTYIFENKEKLDDGITINRIITSSSNKYKKVTKRDIYNKYVNMLVNNPSLFNLNFDYALFEDMEEKEVEKLITEYKKTLKLKWKILEDDESFKIPEEVKDYLEGKKKPRKYKGTKRNPIDVFIEKKEFFDSSDPFIKVEGKDTFDGYVGYVYPNGKVVLDKFYDDAAKKKVAKEQAIYVMDLDDFYTLSHLSKSKIIANRLCKRFYHRGDWQEKVQKEISGKSDSNIVQKTKILQSLN